MVQIVYDTYLHRHKSDNEIQGMASKMQISKIKQIVNEQKNLFTISGVLNI